MDAIKDLARETFRKWYAFSPNPPSNRVNFLNYDVEDIKTEIIEILLDFKDRNSQRLFRLELIRIIREERIVEFERQKYEYDKIVASDGVKTTDIYNWLKSNILDKIIEEVLEQEQLENKTINQGRSPLHSEFRIFS